MNHTQTLPLRLSQNITKRMQMLLLALVLVWSGILTAKDRPFIGYLITIFFAVVTLAVVADLIMRRSYLEISKEGLTISSLFRPYFLSWKHVQGFCIVGIVGARLVGWNYSPNFTGLQVRRRVNTFLVGAEGMLTDYGMKVEELTALLNRLREQYASTSGPHGFEGD
jgi:hypothetical protein